MTNGLSAVTACAAVVTAQLMGARYNPAPNHPRTAAWYAVLRKPSFTPPGPVFGLAWTGLDALLSYSGYRLLRAKKSFARSAALIAWGVNLAGVAGFPWILFGRRRLDAAVGVSGGMVAASTTAIGTAALVDRKAAYASMPLLGWVLFATVLQEEVWRRNR